MEVAGRTAEKLLVLCVDRDDDVEEVANVRTPVVGREEVLKVAVEFATKRPEDSDLNALFAAIQVYDQLVKLAPRESVQVAVVAGTPEGGVEADMKISLELSSVLSEFDADGVILVSDGPTDEQVLPIVQSKVPVVSVKRVVVQQSRGIEDFFVLALRYLDKLVREEKYRKYSLGLPGLFIVLFTILSYSIPQYLWPILTSVLGLILAFKGFSLDEKLKYAYSNRPLTFISAIAGLVLASMALALGYSALTSSGVGGLAGVGEFLLASVGGQIYVVDLLVISSLLALAGKIADGLISGEGSKWGEYVLLAFVMVFRQVLVEVAKLLTGEGGVEALIYWTAFSLMVSVLIAGFFVTKKRIEKELWGKKE